MTDSNRAVDRICQRCRYWHNLENNPTQGECRRYAPRPEAFESIHMMSAWPLTNVDDWCGEFEEAAGTAS